MSELKIITAPSTSPVTLAEARSHLRDVDDENIPEIALKLQAATEYCQRRVNGGRQFMSATYEVTADSFSSDSIDDRLTLPMPPLNRVVFVKYYDTSGVLQTWGSTTGSTGSTAYYTTIKAADTPGYIVPAYGKSWPSTRERPDAVQIRFIAGSTAASSVPFNIKAAVLLKLEHLYDPDRVEEGQTERAINSLLAGANYGYYG